MPQTMQGSTDGAGNGIAGGKAVALARSLARRTRMRVSAMPPHRRAWAAASIAFLAAVCAGLLWYGSRPDYRALFNGLDAKDVQQVSQELAAAGIAYEVTADGAGVQVPAEMLDKARMEVAAKGMPQTGRLGFELFDKPNWVGSEFDEKVNYQRALEGELEHTIATLGAVRSARVHIVLPQQSLYAAQESAAKASVVLKLKRSSMAQDEIESIRSLVAGAVENLALENVTLVDADGRVNFRARSQGAEQSATEQGLEGKLIAMLEPVAGRDNIRATVNLTYDQGSEERTDEVYDPAQVATLSAHRTEQTSGGAGKAGGVPGTASNSPAAAAPGAVAGSQAAASAGVPPLLQKEALPVYPQNGGVSQSVHEENNVYGVTKHTMHMEQGPGRLRRVTAAILVNDRATTDGAAKVPGTLWKPRSAEEMKRMEGLAQAALGFDAKRGDQVVMENVSFSTNGPEPQTAGLERVVEEAHTFLHTQPGLLRTLMVGICCALLVLFVMRPITKELVAALREPLVLSAESRGALQEPGTVRERVGELTGETGDWGALGQGADAGPLGVQASRGPGQVKRAGRMAGHGIFDHVSDHVRREPVQSTRLLEAWIGTTEEPD